MNIVNDVTKLVKSIDPKLGAKNMKTKPNIVFFGSGVIGGSVGAWLSEKYDHVYMLDQGETAKAMQENGITLYWGEEPDAKTNYKVRVVDDLDQVPEIDVIVIAVKNFSLNAVSKIIRDKVGSKPIIIAMQNGLENQKVLPKYFSKIIYCVVSYNAWQDAPGVVGFQKQGPLHFGTKDEEMIQPAKDLAEIFSLGVETHYTSKIDDAAHCKLVINLVNSVTTLVGLSYREISDQAIFQKLITSVTWEGVEVIKKAGYKESKLGGMPSWLILWAGSHLPRAVTKGLFAKNVRKMVVSSMAQDVIQRKAGDSELESINGYLLDLAGKVGHPAPYNRAVYEICKEQFAKPDFEPMDVKDAWELVKERMGK